MICSANLDLRAFVDRLLSRSVLTAEEQKAVLDLPTPGRYSGRGTTSCQSRKPQPTDA
jgi:hypothetical protein